MNNIINDFRKIEKYCNSFDAFQIYDYLYYIGITKVNEEISDKDLIDLIEICNKAPIGDFNPIQIAQSVAIVVFIEKTISIEALKKVPSAVFYNIFLEENLSLLEEYSDKNKGNILKSEEDYDLEIITYIKDLDNSHSFTVSRVTKANCCVELHYNKGTAFLEIGTKICPDKWENNIVGAEWFDKSMSDIDVLDKLIREFKKNFENKKEQTLLEERKLNNEDEMEKNL